MVSLDFIRSALHASLEQSYNLSHLLLSELALFYIYDPPF